MATIAVRNGTFLQVRGRISSRDQLISQQEIQDDLDLDNQLLAMGFRRTSAWRARKLPASLGPARVVQVADVERAQ